RKVQAYHEAVRARSTSQSGCGGGGGGHTQKTRTIPDVQYGCMLKGVSIPTQLVDLRTTTLNLPHPVKMPSLCVCHSFVMCAPDARCSCIGAHVIRYRPCTPVPG
ncbi:unnamed protein product, partial [Ectocarpus sp. 13 AM-2016]